MKATTPIGGKARRIPPAMVLFATLGALVASPGCEEDSLIDQFARFTITPLPSPTQMALETPTVGIDCGRVPIYGADRAIFELENTSSSILQIASITVRDAIAGEFVPVLEIDNRVVGFPAELDTVGTDGAIAYLEVIYSPTGNDGDAGSVTIEIATNAGETHDATAEVLVRGKAWFVGEPNLEIQYAGETYALPADCDPGAGAMNGVCRLPALAFGNVSLDSAVSTGLVLRNVPTAGTCRLPALPDGSPNCTVTCAVTFDADPSHYDLGVGFLPADAGFGISGSAAVPFYLAPAKAGCPDDLSRSMVRGEVELVLRFVAGSITGDQTATMVLESNDPGGPLVEIPLTASSKQAPVAVASLRWCDDENPLPACVQVDDDQEPEIQPLSRVYFDGRDSHDPSGGTIESYRWEIIHYPDGANPQGGVYQPVGAGTALYNIYVPLAGSYVVRLHVTNSEGVESGIGATSDVAFTAVPTSRVHLQLVWDHPQNDQDLHLVYVDSSGRALLYHAQNDCYWDNCKPECVPDPDCEPAYWFTDEEVQHDGNPRLDRDDTNGLGPENINIDRPRPGRYQVFAHYYGLTSEIDDLTQVTVRIYIDGVLRQDYREQLYRNEVWAVAEIVWNEDDSSVVLSPDPDIDPVQELFPLPGSSGWAFEPSPF